MNLKQLAVAFTAAAALPSCAGMDVTQSSYNLQGLVSNGAAAFFPGARGSYYAGPMVGYGTRLLGDAFRGPCQSNTTSTANVTRDLNGYTLGGGQQTQETVNCRNLPGGALNHPDIPGYSRNVPVAPRGYGY